MSTQLKVMIGVGIIVMVVGAIFIFNKPAEPLNLPPNTHVFEPAPAEPAPTPAAPVTPVAPAAPAAPVAPAASGQPTAPVTVTLPPTPAVPVPTPTVVTPPTTQEPRYYVVKKGDSLQKIAELYYGESRHFIVILNANKDLIKDPNKLIAGWKLRIPYPSEVAQ